MCESRGGRLSVDLLIPALLICVLIYAGVLKPVYLFVGVSDCTFWRRNTEYSQPIVAQQPWGALAFGFWRPNFESWLYLSEL